MFRVADSYGLPRQPIHTHYLFTCFHSGRCKSTCRSSMVGVYHGGGVYGGSPYRDYCWIFRRTFATLRRSAWLSVRKYKALCWGEPVGHLQILLFGCDVPRFLSSSATCRADSKVNLPSPSNPRDLHDAGAIIGIMLGLCSLSGSSFSKRSFSQARARLLIVPLSLRPNDRPNRAYSRSALLKRGLDIKCRPRYRLDMFWSFSERPYISYTYYG